MTERCEPYVAGQLPVGTWVRLFDLRGKLGVVGQVLGTVQGYSQGNIHVLRDDGVQETASPGWWQPVGRCPICGREFEEGGGR